MTNQPPTSSPDNSDEYHEQLLEQQLRLLRAGNETVYRDLVAQNMRPHPESVLLLRISTLIQLLLPERGDQLVYEIEFEEGMRALLEQARQQTARARLLSPEQITGPHTGGLFIPGT